MSRLNAEAASVLEDDVESVEARREKVVARLNVRHQHKLKSNVHSNCSSSGLGTSIESANTLLQRLQEFVNSEGSATRDHELEKEVQNMLSFLPKGHHSRLLVDGLHQMRSKFQANKSGISSFAFKSERRLQPVASTGGDSCKHESDVATEMSASNPRKTREHNCIKLVSKENEENLHLNGIEGSEVVIDDVTMCHICVPFNASLAYLSCISKSTLIFAPIRSSILIRDCAETTIVAAAQQIRVHNSRDMTLYVAVRSSVVIEDCINVRVGPYCVDGISVEDNGNWSKVQDFNWLSVDVPSPNWSIIVKDNWIKFHF